MFDKVATIIKTVLKNDNLLLKEEFTAADVKGWDSLHQVMIIAAIEHEFNVKFDFMEMLEIKSISDICNAIERKK